MKKKILFIRLENGIVTLDENKSTSGEWPFSFLNGVISGLSVLAVQTDYELVIVSGNTAAAAAFSVAEFASLRKNVTSILQSENTQLNEVYCEKNISEKELFGKYIFGNYDLPGSFFVAGNEADASLLETLGATSLLINSNVEGGVMNHFQNWNNLVQFLANQPRTASVTRKTNETEISVQLNLDGSGGGNIHTGIGFFDHMLQQLSRHGNLDLDIKVKGDLHIDEHHTIEDTAITLGEAFYQAVGAKKGIERYGFLLPMDDCLAQAAIDFGGRAWLEWSVTFKREKIGEVPTEMFMHFFKSFCDQARCNLNIKAEGENEHHKIESVFKAFAKAIKMAVAKTGGSGIPSTKGIL
jgi:imidazoleglycerol-phosphate dehydratase / histidinol-phosphatase